MSIAALYDIHGNLPALDAVLAEVEAEGVDEIIVGGDVLPGPMPTASLDRLLALEMPVRFIHGNGEKDVLALSRHEMLTRVPEAFHETMRWVARALTPTHLAEIAVWPLSLRVPLALGEVLFCHATPRDDHEIFTRLTSEERLRPMMEATGAAVVVCGHTHMQFDRTIGGVRVVNAGSVGMPFGEPGAHWALIDDDVVLRRTDYDLETAAAEIHATGYPSRDFYDVREPFPEQQMLDTFESSALR
jgi:putative phosphoesterase